ncbi:hypothetical protein [Glycomyces algeriensis]|uniref:Lipoprotein n=1 Tax=Glycomyces algeriensis TaxID=256037 RepID=A0A9W6LGE4_9ACTN|nr:hypothetical protein [Glycomyces algeriensis]MDA1368154.1 hypothetical protein [Glycomyces algeriensis]MDR7348863.1 hypothetical protein [Glycomyces algeriensis]GLI41566.1 hypothetical protein GALLR39Z86_14160 [Glycomyces algeriensis]
MRRLTALATVALLFAVAACTGDGGGDGDNTESPNAEATTGPPEPTAPAALALEPPAGFTAAEGEDREVLLTEDHVSHLFYVAGSEGGQDKITVTSYLLSEGADTSTYDIQAGMVTDYFSKLGSTVSLDNFHPTLVHRNEGIYRYGEKTVGDVEVKWRDYFVFADRYLINITCQWDAHYAQVEAACADLTASFPYPEEWTAAKAA